MSLLSTSSERQLAVDFGGLPRVNLLPPEIEEARRFRRIQAGLAGALAVTAGVVAVLYVGATSSVSQAGEQVDAAAATNTQLQAEAAQYADVTAVYARAAAAEAMLTEAMGQEVRYSGFLSDLSLSVPENVWLKSLSFAQTPPPATVGTTEPGVGSVTVSGVGFSHDDVAVWLESLAGQKGYRDPSFSSSTEALLGTRTVVEFSSTATLTSDALSRAYTTPAGG